MVSCVTAVTCTGAGASVSSFFSSLWQAEASSTSAARGKLSLYGMSCMSKRPRQCLEVRQGEPVAHHAVVVGVASLHQCALRIDHFQSGGLAGLVAKHRQPQALLGEIEGLAERGDLRRRGF